MPKRPETEIIACKELREIRADEWDCMTFEEIEMDYPEEYEVWISDIGRAVCPGGESTSELGERVMKKLREIAEENPGKMVVVTTHATVIRAAETIMRLGSTDHMQEVPYVPNASITEVLYTNGEFEVIKSGYDGHLGDLSTSLPENI